MKNISSSGSKIVKENMVHNRSLVPGRGFQSGALPWRVRPLGVLPEVSESLPERCQGYYQRYQSFTIGVRGVTP